MDVNYFENRVEVGGLRFHQVYGADSQTAEANYPDFILVKSKKMIDCYFDRFKDIRIDDFLELGVLRGGSVAFFNETLKPARHLAIDIHATAAAPLSHMEDRAKSAGRQLACNLSTSQSDIPGIKKAYREQFGREPEFDVIIDDASHFYDLTLASFNGLFPLVKPEGIYVIEDWGWGQWAPFQETSNQLYSEPALSNIIHYCTLGCSSGAAGISRVDITPDSVFIHRDDKPLAEGYAVEKAFPLRGREYAPL